jgi:protein involved in polysaccharide export with SLBB domain
VNIVHLKRSILFFITLGCLSSVVAQQSNMPLNLEDLQKKSEMQLKKTLPFEIQPLESKIDPETYRVGPGDAFQIDIRGGSPEQFELMVTPEQKLLIQNVGEIDLTGMNLQQAKTSVEEFLSTKYRNSQISVSLIALRQFRVYVIGAVVRPGSVTAHGNMRVSDAIKAAGGFQQMLNIEETEEYSTLESTFHSEEISRRSKVKMAEKMVMKPASRRRVQLQRQDGTVYNVDLLKFTQGGDPANNPFLLDGDVIVIPNEQLEVGRIAIWGAVRAPGEFEFVNGDNLADLLNLSQGFTFDADQANIEIVRFKADHKSTDVIRLSLIDGSQVDPTKIVLQPDDRIYVRNFSYFNRKAQVRVSGEVKYPGEYYIIEGQTTLTEVLRRAGGILPRASLAEASLLRKAMEDVLDNEFERLKMIRVEEMTAQEREYYKIKSREEIGKVAVDFLRLFETNDPALDVTLLDRDEIFVPSVGKTIKVSGQVVRPGLITFQNAETFDYYIKKAGGYSWNARRSGVRIIRGQTGEWLKPEHDTQIYLGDTIFIPEKPERDYWELFKDYMMITYQIATIFLVVSQATN